MRAALLALLLSSTPAMANQVEDFDIACRLRIMGVFTAIEAAKEQGRSLTDSEMIEVHVATSERALNDMEFRKNLQNLRVMRVACRLLWADLANVLTD